MTLLITLSVVEIALLIAGLAFYLLIVGGQLTRIATNLEASYETAGEIVGHASLIDPGLDHINRTGGVVAGALPLLYGMAEGIVRGATWTPKTEDRAPAMPASGRRRSRIMESVGVKIGSD